MTFWQGVLRPKYPFEGLKILKHGRLHVRKYCEEWTHASMHQLCYLKQRHTHNKVHLTIVPKKTSVVLHSDITAINVFSKLLDET